LNQQPFINASYIAACVICGLDFIQIKPLYPYTGDLNLSELVFDEKMYHLRRRIPFDDMYLAKAAEVIYFLKALDCPIPSDLSRYGIKS
jgi:hypothetical protein